MTINSPDLPSPVATTPAARRQASNNLALAVVVVGVLIAAVDTTIVVLALPKIEVALTVNVSDVIWIIISYLLVITVLATQVGRLGDMFGRVRMYESGFAVFVVGSLLCGLAPNEATMIGFRVIQGVGGALVSANSGAVIADLFPPEKRGTAYGFNSIGWNLGAILGILLGGLITTIGDWRWIFLINVPIGLTALAVAVRVLHDHSERHHRRIDWLGTLGLGGGLFCILWAVTQFTNSSLTTGIALCAGGGVVLLIAFALWERHFPEPVLDFSLFRVPSMTPALLAAFLQSLANFAVLFLVIMYLQGVRNLTPLAASGLLVPGYVIGAAVGPFGGWLADRFGPVWPASVGLVIQAVGLAIYSLMGVSTGLWLVVLASCINGIGAGGFFPANSSAVMKAAPGPLFGLASGVLRTFSNVGMVFSFAVAIVVAAHAIPRGLAFAIFVGNVELRPQLATAFTSGLHAAFLVSLCLMLVAAMLSAVRGKPEPHAALQATPGGTGTPG